LSVTPLTPLSSRPEELLFLFFDNFAFFEEGFTLDFVELAINYQMRANVLSTPNKLP
jgi:hypothetical protein